MHNSCTYCHHLCEYFTIHEWCHVQWKNEIMNGDQGDHVTFLWTWRRSKQRLSFCCTFQKFIQHHDADAVRLRTLRSLMSHFLQRGLVWAVRLWIFGCSLTIYSKCHTWMLVCKMYNTSKATTLWKPPSSGSAVLSDKNDPSCFSNLQT